MAIYLRETSKAVDRAARDLEAAVTQHGFGVLHTYDFRKTLADKGFDLPHECRVLEVCNPRQASEVLKVDMSLNMVLPCRLSVYQDHGKTLIGMVPPSDLLALVSHAPALTGTAAEVEQAMKTIIDEAV